MSILRLYIRRKLVDLKRNILKLKRNINAKLKTHCTALRLARAKLKH